METWKPILSLLGGIGVINALLFSIFLLLSKQRKPHHTYLALMLLAIAVRVGKSIYFYYADQVDKLILQIGLTACAFIGPFFLLYIKSAREAERRQLALDKFIVALIGITVLLVGILYPYRTTPDTWNGPIVGGIYAVWTVFVLLGLQELRPLLAKAIQNFGDLDKSEKRLLGIAGGIVLITATYQFAFWVHGFTYLWGSLILTGLFYYLIYKEIGPFLQQQLQKRSAKHLPPANGNALLLQIERAMSEQKLYKQPALKLRDLATATGLRPHLLSQVLNDVYPNGFATYVNEKRIEEAKKLICSDSSFTLEGIGYESGFNSKSSFYATFKKLTGCTPAEYKNREMAS